MSYAIIEAPSILGLFPSGVEDLPEALFEAGLTAALGARRAGRLEPPPYESRLDPQTQMRNPTALREYAQQLAAAITGVLANGDVPIVLGGDCSILLGNMLALRRRGRYGLMFIDGHADFYQPEAEPNGEAASMDLALVTGRGPNLVTSFGEWGRLVRDDDVVHLGRRDAREAEAAGSQRIEDTPIEVLDLAAVRGSGVAHAVQRALTRLTRPGLEGFWIHLDCDVLDDAIMPAVDYRLAGGLSWSELETMLRLARSTGHAVGLDVTIFNPRLDGDGSVARRLVRCLAAGL